MNQKTGKLSLSNQIWKQLSHQLLSIKHLVFTITIQPLQSKCLNPSLLLTNQLIPSTNVTAYIRSPKKAPRLESHYWRMGNKLLLCQGGTVWGPLDKGQHQKMKVDLDHEKVRNKFVFLIAVKLFIIFILLIIVWQIIKSNCAFISFSNFLTLYEEDCVVGFEINN